MKTNDTWRGFTLIELLVVVLIIGVLAAIALPMYQKAVLKSRFTSMMPLAKTLAESNEIYYLDHGNYAENPEELTIQGKDTTQEAYADGTTVLMYSDAEDLSFVRTENNNIPNARYVVYQKHSKNFPDTTWCEAGDTRAEEMCVALGGVIPTGVTGNNSGEDGWKAYLLSGQAREGDIFAAGGNENAGSGNNTSGGLDAATLAKLQAQVDNCRSGATCSINEKNGTVTSCSTSYGKMEDGECVPTGTGYAYRQEYNVDGQEVGTYWCDLMTSGTCTQYKATFTDYNPDDSLGINYCVASSIGSDGKCETYYKMEIQAVSADNKYSLTRICADISNTTCNSYVNTRAWAYDTNNNYTEIACANTLSNGTCSGYRFRQNNRWSSCTDESTINWETATCS